MPVRLWKTGVTDQSIICLPLQNNEMIPIELVQKSRSSNFQEGMQRQLSFGMLDMGWHAKTL
jgi:Zn-dependent oligopeptidase